MLDQTRKVIRPPSDKIAIRPKMLKGNITSTIITDNMLVRTNRCSPVSRISHTEEITEGSVEIISIPFRIVVSPAQGHRISPYMPLVEGADTFKIYSGLPPVAAEDVGRVTNRRMLRDSTGNRTLHPMFNHLRLSQRQSQFSRMRPTTPSGLRRTYRWKTSPSRKGPTPPGCRQRGAICHHQHEDLRQSHRPKKDPNSASPSNPKQYLYQHQSRFRISLRK